MLYNSFNQVKTRKDSRNSIYKRFNKSKIRIYMGFERNRVKSLVFVVSDKYFIDHESGSRSIYMCRYT